MEFDDDDAQKMPPRLFYRLCAFVFISSVFVCMIFFNLSFKSSDSSTLVPNNFSPSQQQNILPQEDPNESTLKGELNYGVIIDAGSSGSRLFVYVWPQHSGNSEDLIKIEPLKDSVDGKPIVKKISPGLSSFGSRPENASTYMIELLDFAASHIPKAKHKETSLFILATAGLRLIPESEGNAILKNLREELPKRYEFIIMDSHIEIISGKWEGIYSWIAVNYALNRFDAGSSISPADVELIPITESNSNQTRYRKRTVGMIDMGGGSVQIAFETFDKVPRMQEHLTQELNLGCHKHDTFHTYKIYVTTFLGFGANVAMDRYEEYLRNANPGRDVIQDPCLPTNLVKSVVLNGDNKNDDSQQTNQQLPSYSRKGVGDFDKCETNLKRLLNMDVKCSDDPCSFNGVYQPKINYSALEIFGFSEYWYTTDDILKVSGPYNYTNFKDAASKFCSTKWSVLKRRQEANVYPKADKARLRTQCFKSGWISVVLHDGFGLPKNTSKFKSVSSINGQEVQWTLGALLYRLRHFPLRELQRLKESQLQPPYRRNGWNVYLPSDNVFQFLLFICIFIVVLAAWRYFMNLRRLKLPASSKVQMMTRNKSLMGYMMIDNEDGDFNSLKNIRVESSNYVY